MSPSAWSQHQHGKNDTSLYNVSESVIFIEKSSNRGINKPNSRINSSANSSCNSSAKEKRHPLLDRVKHTRLSCFKSSNSSLSDTSSASSTSVQNRRTKLDLDSFNNNSEKVDLMEVGSSESGRGSFLSTKVRAVSEKYLHSSTNKFLAKLYKHHESAAIEPTTSSKTGNKKRVRSKLRSFSYGALPGLEHFEEDRSPIRHGDDSHVLENNHYDDEILLMGHEDSDSGIIVNDSVPRHLENDLRRENREARESDIPNFHNQLLSMEYRKATTDFQKVLTNGRQMESKMTQRKPIVLLIRLRKSSPDEGLGILIAKSKKHSGYIVRDIIPDGLADRYVTFQ